jgi:hypothetical protein
VAELAVLVAEGGERGIDRLDGIGAVFRFRLRLVFCAFDVESRCDRCNSRSIVSLARHLRSLSGGVN